MEALRLYGSIGINLVRNLMYAMRSCTAPVRDKISDSKSQKRLILVIVCIALLLDNMLYMVIVPIITEYFKTSNATIPHLSGSTLDSGITSGHGNLKLSSLNVSTVKFLPTVKHQKAYPLTIAPPHEEANEDALIGILFASKAIVQLMANPFTGTFIDRVGYVTPLTLGLIVMFMSTTLFALAETYSVLFIARSLQGLGSALADTASLGLIADRFQDEAERSKALGIALAFISFGSLVAPPFGGVLCEFAGREWPFLILAFVCLVDALLLLLVQIPASDENKAKDGNIPVGTPIYKLFIDPYIAIIAVSLTVANFPLAFLEPTIAKWMEDTMNSTKWQIGLVWLPAFIPHVLGVYMTVKASVKYFRYQWLLGAIGLVMIGISTATVSMCHSYGILMIPLAFLCFGIALIDTALLPTLAFLVDVRHTSVYGSVYAIADISYSVAYSLGPILAGQAVHAVGYLKMNVGIGLANILFSPLLFLLKEVYDWKTDKSERTCLMDQTTPIGPGSNVSNNVNKIKRNDSTDSNSSDNSENFSNHVENTNTNHSSYTVETSINPIPRPRPRVSSQVTNGSTNVKDQKFNTTTFLGDGSQTKKIKSRTVSENSISKIEFEEMMSDGVELRNPIFENENETIFGYD